MTESDKEVGMLNIVIPMAGRGSRFEEAGYKNPKPLIPVHGVPMIEVVINNLRPQRPHRFTFICQREHALRHGLPKYLYSIAPGSSVILIDGVTEGAACTVLLARSEFAGKRPLMIANCDQWINASVDEYLAAFDRAGTDSFVMTMTSQLPKWSYVQRDANGHVLGMVEKRVVSNEASVGIYNFARGDDFIHAAEAMIAANDRTNGEFYVAPSYSWLSRAGKTIEAYTIGSDQDGMYGLGTPGDLDYFLTCGFEQRLMQERSVSHRQAA
jgi:dTDP-glucose pyrophosphorylase